MEEYGTEIDRLPGFREHLESAVGRIALGYAHGSRGLETVKVIPESRVGVYILEEHAWREVGPGEGGGIAKRMIVCAYRDGEDVKKHFDHYRDSAEASKDRPDLMFTKIKSAEVEDDLVRIVVASMEKDETIELCF